ncbi:uncharacterized protein LOC119833329 [Zerene cesonia]|uniref:uncharacterized protein LOC119833329 n=1 Tax=Zerene cesonia TaxID=33412 RepID=UPI0018E51221|nr:uncharacterized protein LOC119833329 [Zerene cesonia]
MSLSGNASFCSNLMFDHRAQEWCIFISRFKQCCTANDIDDRSDKAGVKRRALSLTALVEDTYRVAKDLVFPTDLEDIEYATLVQKLNDHFIAKRSTFAERYLFYKAEQRPGEDLNEWASRVRHLAQHCGFKARLDTALRDRFVLGLVNSKEKEKLFAENIDNLSFSKALEMALNVQCARAALQNADVVSSGSSQPGVERGSVGVFAVRPGAPGRAARASTFSEKVLCVVCGGKGHSKEQCRFKSYSCNKCGKQGHLQRVCNMNVKRNNYVEMHGKDSEVGELFNIKCLKGEPMRLFCGFIGFA